jgi:hypothetical protein
MADVFAITDAAKIAHAPYSGVRWSGMSDELDHRPSPAEQRAATTPTAREVAAFAASPRGRFLAALHELEPGYGAEAERARACNGRGFADPALEPVAQEVGRALEILAPINTPDARAAIAALGELLSSARRAAA